MFSFWSNDEDEGSDNGNKGDAEKEQSKLEFYLLLNLGSLYIFFVCLAGKPERFRYVSKRAERNTVNTCNTGQLRDDVLKNNCCIESYKEKRKQMDGIIKALINHRSII